jgi:hypothetical protein
LGLDIPPFQGFIDIRLQDSRGLLDIRLSETQGFTLC